jgi:chorismate dehydratase
MILGVVPFLNVKPLVFPLEQNLIKHDWMLAYSPPASLPQLMDEGSVDVGLLPVAELFRRRSVGVIPGISISSFGRVESVVLLSKVPLSNIKAVAVDARSKSSTALLRIVLEVFCGIVPLYDKRLPGDGFLSGVDAAMIIGDEGLRSMHSPPTGFRVHDLGEIWTRETGLPFVYAVYAVRRGVRLGESLGTLEASKHLGISLAEKIARLESDRIGIGKDICYVYITERIRYNLGEDEIRGIEMYEGFLRGLFADEDSELNRDFKLPLYEEV